MKENYKINDNQKPLLDIENDLTEMSKIVKIIISLKNDIEGKIDNTLNDNNMSKIDILFIEKKYNKIKEQTQKFMDKKKYIFNFIRNENTPLNAKTMNLNIIKEDENENLLEENKTEYVMENIKKMQNEIKNKINILDEKLTKIKFLEKKGSLIEEINKNDINDFDINSNNNRIQEYETSLLNTKAFIHNEETKELEKVSNKIEKIKKGTNEMKLFLENQGDKINYLENEQKQIGEDIEKGLNELSKTKDKKKEKNKKYIICIGCLILLIIVFVYAIYKKVSK